MKLMEINSNKNDDAYLQACTIWCTSIYNLLMLSQLESSLSSFVEVRQTSSLLRVSWKVCPTVLEPNGLLFYTKGCPDQWSGHAPSKIKSNKSSSNYFMRESECMYVRIPCSCFLKGLYKVDDTITVVLTMHSDPSCNDDCP